MSDTIFDRQGNLDEKILLGLPYTAFGVDFDNKSGLGSVPDVANVGYKGVVARIRPSVFLALTPPIQKVKSFASENGKSYTLGTPFLDLDLGEDQQTVRVRGHEGRHRMAYLRDVVHDNPIPVALFLTENHRALRHRDIEPRMIDAIQKGLETQRCAERPTTFMEGPLFEDIMYYDCEGNVVRFHEIQAQQMRL